MPLQTLKDSKYLPDLVIYCSYGEQFSTSVEFSVAFFHVALNP